MTALIFDLAGTTIDCGCMAPVSGFIEVFARRGVLVDERTARGPMGTHKREHIRRMCLDAGVKAAWTARHGAAPTDADIDAMYAEAEPLQVESLRHHVDVIPGFLDALARSGLRYGATTGYTTPMVRVLRPLMAEKGWSPEVLVCASDVPEGRPAPLMNFAVAQALGAEPRECVVFGDTVVDMQAARAAGMLAVGVALTGNELGLPWERVERMDGVERERAIADVGARLREAGADRVIGSVAELEGVL